MHRFLIFFSWSIFWCLWPKKYQFLNNDFHQQIIYRLKFFIVVNFAMCPQKKYQTDIGILPKWLIHFLFLKVFRDLVYCLYLRKASLQETSNTQCMQNHRKFSFMISICYELIYLMDLFFNVWDFSGLCAQHIRCILDICSSIL